MKILFISLLLLAHTITVYANSIDINLDNCLNHSSTTPSISLCYSNAANAWDNKMNIAYSKLLSILDKEQKKDLIESQKSWLKYRDNYFTFLRSFYTRDGSIWGNVGAKKRMFLIKEKAQNLEGLYNSVQSE